MLLISRLIHVQELRCGVIIFGKNFNQMRLPLTGTFAIRVKKVLSPSVGKLGATESIKK